MKPQAKTWEVKWADNCSPYSHAQHEDIVESNRPHIQPWTYKLVMPLSMVARVHNPSILGAETVGLPFGMCHMFEFVLVSMVMGALPICLSGYHMCALARPEEGLR